MAKKNKKTNKEFGLSSWAIGNKTTIYVAMIIILFSGVSAYLNMPRENFPEIKDVIDLTDHKSGENPYM